MRDSRLPKAQHSGELGMQYGDKLVQVAPLYTVAAVCEGRWMQLSTSTVASLGRVVQGP